MIRSDVNDQLYTTKKGRTAALIRDIEECVKTGQPVLVGTVSVEKSEALSEQLKRKGIRHNVLNAKNHEQEAEIVAQAGRLNSVTLATNMAGRGTDIMLGGNPEFMARQKLERDGIPHEVIVAAMSFAPTDDPAVISAKTQYDKLYAQYKAQCDEEKEKVVSFGGLHIIGTERHESRRIDNQLRGRAGRQGDPGSTVFYIAMEDDMARIFGGPMMLNWANRLKLDEDTPISFKILTNGIEKAQKRLESRNYGYRKHVLSYDDVMNRQREIIYGERNKVLSGLDVRDQIREMIAPVATEILYKYVDFAQDFNTWNYDMMNKELEEKLLSEGSGVVTKKLASKYDFGKILDAVMEVADKSYDERIKAAEQAGIDFHDVERFILLRTVDEKWMEHIDAMDQLRKGIGLRAHAQVDPVRAYQKEGYDMFEAMTEDIKRTTVSRIMKLNMETALVRREQPKDITTNNPGSPAAANVPAKNEGDKVGRNDPCPCGSGRKYKNCCINK